MSAAGSWQQIANPCTGSDSVQIAGRQGFRSRDHHSVLAYHLFTTDPLIAKCVTQDLGLDDVDQSALRGWPDLTKHSPPDECVNDYSARCPSDLRLASAEADLRARQV